jgi:cell division protein FtsL
MIFRLSICFVAFSLCFYAFIEKQNRLTQLQISLPNLSKEIKAIQEENVRLQYEIDQCETPQRLMQLHRAHPHLRYPITSDILTLYER